MILQGSAASNAYKAFRPDVHQFLRRNGSRRAAHAGGGDGNLDPLIKSGEGAVFPVNRNKFSVIKIPGHAVGTRGVTWQKHIFSYIARFQMNVILLLSCCLTFFVQCHQPCTSFIFFILRLAAADFWME